MPCPRGRVIGARLRRHRRRGSTRLRTRPTLAVKRHKLHHSTTVRNTRPATLASHTNLPIDLSSLQDINRAARQHADVRILAESRVQLRPLLQQCLESTLVRNSHARIHTSALRRRLPQKLKPILLRLSGRKQRVRLLRRIHNDAQTVPITLRPNAVTLTQIHRSGGRLLLRSLPAIRLPPFIELRKLHSPRLVVVHLGQRLSRLLLAQRLAHQLAQSSNLAHVQAPVAIRIDLVKYRTSILLRVPRQHAVLQHEESTLPSNARLRAQLVHERLVSLSRRR